MDVLAILEQYGIPICVSIAFGFFIWKQNKFIQEELKSDMDENNKRIEEIVISLINAQKKLQVDFGKELTRMEGSYRSLTNIIQKLSGNGLKKKN